MEGKTLKKNWYDIGLLAVVVVYTVFYISLIFNQNIWTDEAYTIELVRGNDWLGIIRGTADDVHPPLYYLIDKLGVILFGDSFAVYKLVSVIPMILQMLLAYVYIRPWWGYRAAYVYVLFLNAIPCVLEYVIQIRMYSWAMLFVTWAFLCAAGILRESTLRRRYIGLAAASLLACYTHTYAMLSCVCIYLLLAVWLFRKGQWKKWLISGLVVAVLYLPWLFVLFRQTMNRVDNYWIASLTWEEVCTYPDYWFQSGSNIPYLTWVFMLLLVVGLAECLRRRKIEGTLALAVPVLTAVIGIAVSVLITPFFIARYIVPCMGLLALFAAIGFCKASGPALAMLFSFCVICFADSYCVNYVEEYESTQTDELIHYLDENMGENDYIVYNYEAYGFIYQIYFDEERILFLNDMDFSQDFEQVWFFDSAVTPWLSQQVLDDNGLEKEFVARMGIEQNDFALYRIYHAE